jgi:hypothetical protein
VIQLLLSTLAHAGALVLYPGLLTMVAAGTLIELAWMRGSRRAWEWPELPRRRPTPVVATVAVCAVIAAVQLAAPLNPVPGDERSVVLAAIALAFTAWAQLALTVEFVAAPGLLLLAQVCWLSAVLGLAVQPESLRPQVLGNVVVPGLLPVKVACALLYLLCLPALLRLWPFAAHTEKRVHVRLDAGRILTWLPYCGLFTTLFLPPPADDVFGLLRFFGVTLAVAALVIGLAVVLRRLGTAGVRSVYVRGVAPYAAVVLAIVVATSILMR